MNKPTTKTFRSGNSQAVRIPKEFAYPEGTELEIVKEGDVLTLKPRRISIKEMVTRIRELPKPTTLDEREPFEAPERPGL